MFCVFLMMLTQVTVVKVVEYHVTVLVTLLRFRGSDSTTSMIKGKQVQLH